MTIDLNAIRARLQTISEWPWNGNSGMGITSATGEWVCQFFSKAENDFDNLARNIHFVVHAPGDIAALVAEIERLQAELAAEHTARLNTEQARDLLQQGNSTLLAEVERMHSNLEQLKAELPAA